MSATAGKVALVKTTNKLSGDCPKNNTNVVDFVGYGSNANCHEGGNPAPAPSNTTSILRQDSGCIDTSDNKADFSAGAPSPKNKSSAPYACSCSLVGTQNESGLPAEIDLCNIQSPGSITVAAMATTPLIYGRVTEAGVTEAAGANAMMLVEVGYGPSNVNPTTQSGWVFFPATYNMQVIAADEYQGSFVAPMMSGTYRYAVRASLDGTSWTYCDLNGTGSSAGAIFEITQLPLLNVTP
jgi:hypothetical protein